MLISRLYVKVTNICYCSNFHKTKMTNLLLKDCKNYSVNDIIVSPALSLQILRHLSLNRKEYFVLEVNKRTTIANIKEIIYQKKNIPLSEQFFYIETKQTLLKDSLAIRSIYNDNLVIQLYHKEYYLK